MKDNIVLYYRDSLMEKDELKAARQHFHCVDLLSEIPTNSFVVGRFSLYPFYYDQQRELACNGSKLINTHLQYSYIADLQNYVYDLKELTPKTWSRLEDLPENMSFVLKGETNSRKNAWKTSMFAKDKRAAIEVHGKLSEDFLIGCQQIYAREYIPLFKYFDGIGGMPVTKEFRFFIAYGEVISGDFYWQNYVDDMDHKPDPNEVPREFLQKVIDRVGDNSHFYVIDVALTQKNEWIVIELNEGQFSGLSCNDPEILYKKLKEVIRFRR